MTSNFARHGGLSRRTHEAEYYCAHPRHVNDRLNFYIKFFQDVVPHGVTVQHIPTGLPENKYEEIQLLTPSGTIFMSGLVGTDSKPTGVENVAASEAYTNWLDGDFAPDGQNWRFFTGLAQLRLFKSKQGDSWDTTHTLRAMDCPQYVADLLQEQYDGLRHY